MNLSALDPNPDHCFIPEGSTEACKRCGFTRPPLPAWAVVGAVFALDGNTYRIVAAGGSSNRRTNANHSEETVHAELVEAAPWEGLPDAPCSKDAVGASLQALFSLPIFFVDDLRRAIHVERGR